MMRVLADGRGEVALEVLNVGSVRFFCMRPGGGFFYAYELEGVA